MKIFQISDGFCWWDATATVHSLKQAEAMFPPDVLFVEAPDYVHEGWVYDEHEKGDARFIRPEPPEGYGYDEKSGTFYSLDGDERGKTDAERLAELIDQMTALVKEAETLLAEIGKVEEKEERK